MGLIIESSKKPLKTLRKNLLLLAFAAGALFVMINNLYSMNDIVIYPGDRENTAICYSTFTPGGEGFLGIGASPEVWRCGDCVRVRATNFSDAGTCRF